MREITEEYIRFLKAVKHPDFLLHPNDNNRLEIAAIYPFSYASLYNKQDRQHKPIEL